MSINNFPGATPGTAVFGLRLASALLMLGATSTQAQITVNVGTHNLLPNTPGQEIQLNVSGSGAVAGLNFFVQVGDGFPDFGGTTDGPNIAAVDVIGTVSEPTIFFGNNTGQTDPGSGQQIGIRNISTSSGTISPNGLLAILIIDTTGFSSGTFGLSLSNGGIPAGTEFLDSVAALLPATLIDGFINITPVPEPTFVAMVAGGALGAFALVRRLRRH